MAAPVTEIYVVLTLHGDLEDEDVRTLASAMLDYAAEEILRPGYRGGITASEDEDGEIEIMIIDEREAAARAADLADGGPGGRWRDEPGDA